MSIAECPRCGYHLETDLKVRALDVHLANDAVEDPQKGVSALEAEVRRLEDLIPRLQEEKASLLRRINNTREKTRWLPFEVLSNIFQFARPPIDFTAYEPMCYEVEDPDHPPLTGYFDPAEHFHHTLAAVSHRWRQVALSTPQLWTSISLRVLNTFIEFDTSLLDLYFKNAHNIPVSIRLDLSNPALAWMAVSCLRRADFLTRLEPLEEIIFDRNADKIHSLVFIEAPVEWFTRDCGKLSRCTSVTMYWPSLGDLDNFHFDFADLPCLQHVMLVGTSFKLTLPTTITVLQLSHVNLTGRLGLLAELLNLIELETTQVVAGSFAFEVTNTAMEQIVLHRLERLTWRDMRVIGNHEFLRFVHFVHLTTLVWDTCIYLHEFLSEKRQGLRLAFFSSLPSTLSSLTIRDIEIDSDLLGSIPQLAELHFIRSPRPVVIGAVEAIGRPPANRGASSSSSTILSNLSVLSVSDIGSGVDAFVFVGMLETLHATGPRLKRFHLTTHSDVEWHADALHRVQDLLSSGLDVRVTFDSGGSTSSVP